MDETEPDALATLTFNALAVRELFASDRAKGLKLRIDRGSVTLRSVIPGHGVDIIAIERRPRGVAVPVDTHQRRLIDRLYKAGLTEEQPYFVLEPASPRGWFTIDHCASDHAPQGQPYLVVSGFDPPPVPIDLTAWRRFQRALKAERSIDDVLWQNVHRMILTAVRFTAHPTRGRQSQQRIDAHRLITLAKRAVPELLDWRERQPTVAAKVAELVTKITGEEPPVLATVVPIQGTNLDADTLAPEGTVTHVSLDYVSKVLTESEPEPVAARPGRRRRRVEPVTDDVVEVPTGPEADPIEEKRRWPRIPAVDLDDDPTEQATADDPVATDDVEDDEMVEDDQPTVESVEVQEFVETVDVEEVVETETEAETEAEVPETTDQSEPATEQPDEQSDPNHSEAPETDPEEEDQRHHG